MVALGAAVLAVAVSVVAAIIVLTRSPASSSAAGASGSASAAGGALSDRSDGSSSVLSLSASAADVYRLRDQLDVVNDAGVPRGVRVNDVALANTLGLVDGDVILSLSGRPTTRQGDVADVLLRAGTMRATTVYAEVERRGMPLLVRWQLDGNLLDARRDAMAAQRASSTGALGSFGTLGAGGIGTGGTGLRNPFTDPDPAQGLLDQIERVDDTHVRVPRKTLDALLANATAFTKGARIVPAYKNGVHEGFKLYAIRPSSLYARLGLRNGDSVERINGADLVDVDDLVMLVADAKNKVATYKVDIVRRGSPVSLHIEITK